MKIQLSEHFTYKKMIQFVLPSIVMMIFTSIYGVIDGLFVSNFVGKTAFAAINLIMPLLMGLSALGFMIGTGGSAIVSKALGEGRRDLANQYFSMLVYVSITGGIILAVTGMFLLRPIALLLGASGELIELCVLYGRILLVSLTAFLLQNVFQSFFVTAEKPQLGLKVTIAAGLTNIVLDYLFIAVFRWGIAGAAVATAISETVGGLFPILYFARKNESLLQLVKAPLDVRALGKACANGSSELMTNLSMSIVNSLYNLQLISIAGENGVAAYGTIMYVNFIFIAIFLGYSIGSAPIIGYHYGAGSHDELKNLLRMSLSIVGICGILLILLAQIMAAPLAGIFVGYDSELEAVTCHGFRLYAVSFLICGFNIFGSAFFTALGNGIVSAAISFLRTLVFQTAVLLTLPLILGINGIWLAMAVAEALTLIITVWFLVNRRKQYHYA
ncbi:MAG: MATE family efflux transporter [Dorea sp.]|jgi:putative MATE family efflux protein|nr:MATE family efflux transporter [Dorea sp.]